MATRALSGAALLIYSPAERVWLGSDKSGTTWRADTAPQRLIQAVITPREKHARAGKLNKKKKKTYRQSFERRLSGGGCLTALLLTFPSNFSFCCSLKARVVTVTSDKSLQGPAD